MKGFKAFVYAICGVLLLYAGWNLFNIHQSTDESIKLYENLAVSVHATESSGEVDDAGCDVSDASTDDAGKRILKLQELNPDTVGWLTIPDTGIDYPVMQTKEDNDYYLTHDFNGNYQAHGTPFMDVNCDLAQSDNLIIYGHNMKDGTMFQELMLYKDASFCQENEQIEWTTVEGKRTFRIIHVLCMSESDFKHFPYYLNLTLDTEELYSAFLKRCARFALWSSPDQPEYGKQLMTLSTCEYSNDNGRFVVIGVEE